MLPTAPRSIDSLLNLAKDSKVYVGIVDDPIEVAYRIMGDHNRKIQDLDIYPAPLWKNVRFIIDIPRFFPFEKIAIFTWHGIANQHLLSKDNLSFALPLQNLQVGYDLVCIVSKEKRRFSYLKDFVLKLTSEEHTEVNIKYNQYFSPYVDPVHAYLHPRFKKIYSESLQKLSSGNYVETRMMRGQQLKLVNEWWHKRRYGQ